MYPVYRPSTGNFVWVNSLKDVMFISLGEKLLAEEKTIIKEDDRFMGISLIGRMFYSGRGK